ncbi:Uncharacterised protein [Serratia fonticola]|nr:Uncharacterised protein [Serratia fonticola]
MLCAISTHLTKSRRERKVNLFDEQTILSNAAYTRRLSSCSVVTCTYSPQSLTKRKLLGMSKLVA